MSTSARAGPLAGPSSISSPSTSSVSTSLDPPPQVPPIPFRKPGKSILKQPPPPQPKFFSFQTITKLLPNQPSSASSGNLATSGNGVDDGGKGIRGTPLKRAHFILPNLSTTYPIWSSNPPASPTLSQEKAEIEQREHTRRARLVRGNSVSSLKSYASQTGSTNNSNASSVNGADGEYWGLERVEQFYKECCFGREEGVDLRVVKAIKAAGSPPRSLVLSGVELDAHSAVALADLFTIEWGLRKLVLKECALDELALKPLLHSLLLPNSLSYLSLSSNPKLKASAWRLVGVYLSKATTLQFLDLSGNNLDKRSVELITAALGTIPPSLPSSTSSSATPSTVPSTPTLVNPPLPTVFPSNIPIASSISSLSETTKPHLTTLRLDSTLLRPAALEALAHAIRQSPLQHISLRNNRIGPPGGVALALMIKDYPDTYMPGTPTSTTTNGSVPSSPSVGSMPLSPPPVGHRGFSTQQAVRASIIPPPPSPTPAQANPGTTYTPYVPRSKRASAIATVNLPASPGVEERESRVPSFSTSWGGGVTTRHNPQTISSGFTDRSPSEVVNAATLAARQAGPSVALLDKVRALDSLPRLGALKTLDLRGNDLKTGVSYVSQVLKRNRTLKILNLADNKIGPEGLANIADALKYNTSLETLDLSYNPCCAPSLTGITSLRTAFTLNTALKRLFLSSTSLNSAGAIMLAEFLPESSSLLHLDLTGNDLEMAGVMALSEGLKANVTMRCLDLNIPPGDEEMARLCREILNWCIRNTERADKRARSEGAPPRGRGIWGMIEDSALARDVRKGEKHRIELDTLSEAHSIHQQLESLLRGEEASILPTPSTESTLLAQAHAILQSLVVAIEASNDPDKLEEMLALNDNIGDLVKKIESKPIRPILELNGLGGLNGTSMGTPDRIFSPQIASEAEARENASLEDTPITPRLDKGKGKAVLHEEPEEMQEEEGKIIPEPGTGEENLGSPTDSRSRIWVEEEGEVFRKGVALLTPEKMEGELGDFAGDDLRIELLETEVERPPARILEVDGDGEMVPENVAPLSPPVPRMAKATPN